MVIVMVAMIPWTAIPLALLGIIFFLLQLYFLNTSGNVKAWNVQVSTGALRLGWQCRLASIYAVITQTSDILQTLSSGISP